MTKSRKSVVALASLLVLAIIGMAIPTTAMGAISSVTWEVPTYKGYDSFYATNVVAFTAGTTAEVTVQVYNDKGVDVTITEAKMVLDWGAVVTATVAPTDLTVGETGTFTFDVPVPDTATNAVLHNYQVIVGFQRQDTSYVVSLRSGEFVGAGDGATTAFNLDFSPVLASTLRVYWQDTGATPDTLTLKDPSTYVLDPRIGRITFGAAPAATIRIYADYQYFQSLGSGNGVNTIFFTGSKPVASSSLQVYVANAITETWVQATGWTVDPDTGKITLASAPTSFETVYATYQYWERWAVWSATNLAVYTADQAGAIAASQQYNNMNANYPAYLFTPGTAAAKAQEEASVLAAKAALEYSAGDFANSKTDYSAAITSLQSAIDSDNTLNSSLETTLTGLLSGAGGVVDAYAAKLNAEAKQANGQASMYKNVGVFTILLGVATLLAGLGGILWAYSRLVAARGPKQV